MDFFASSLKRISPPSFGPLKFFIKFSRMCKPVEFSDQWLRISGLVITSRWCILGWNDLVTNNSTTTNEKGCDWLVSPNPYAAGDFSSPNKSVFGSKTRCHLFGVAKQQPKWWNICWSSGALGISIDLRKNSTENGVSAARCVTNISGATSVGDFSWCSWFSWREIEIGTTEFVGGEVDSIENKRATNRRFSDKISDTKKSRIDKGSHWKNPTKTKGSREKKEVLFPFHHFFPKMVVHPKRNYQLLENKSVLSYVPTQLASPDLLLLMGGRNDFQPL